MSLSVGCWVQDLDLEGFSDQAFMLSPAPSAPGGGPAGASSPAPCCSCRLAEPAIWSRSKSPAPIECRCSCSFVAFKPSAPIMHASALCPVGAYASSGTGSGAPLLLSTLADAPKIRVIVRKRPLNRKVGATTQPLHAYSQVRAFVLHRGRRSMNSQWRHAFNACWCRQHRRCMGFNNPHLITQFNSRVCLPACLATGAGPGGGRRA